ncbi:MAG: hypothetical protein ACOCXG_01170 [Nanoarchaeota archaeon]
MEYYERVLFAIFSHSLEYTFHPQLKSWGIPRNKRLESTQIRQDLTDEWNERGIKERKDYAILTNEIHKATFDKNIKEHKEFKDLSKRNNLRDNMTTLELIFSMLGEHATKEITKSKDSTGFGECFDSAQTGGKIAGNARKELEKQTKQKVISKGGEVKRLE